MQEAKNNPIVSRSMNSVFVRFPTISEVDRLILSADVAAILKTIQTIGSDSSVTCNQRINYLLELQGRLRAAIEKKTFSADQLRVINDNSIA